MIRTPKTNALRLLDEAGIDYSLRPYVLADDEFSAEAVAEQLGLPLEQVFKTLLALGAEKGPVFAVVPAGSELDLKRLASHRGERRIELAPRSRVLELTGYRRGAVTVIGAVRQYPVVVDEIIDLHTEVAISAGAKGLQVLLASRDFLALTGAEIADISR